MTNDLLSWIMAGGLLLIGGAGLPLAIRTSKRATGKRRGVGMIGALGMALVTVLDPPKAAAMEQIDRQKDGEADEREDAEGPSGADIDPPV